MGVDEAIEKYRSYFNEKIERYGAVPRGVDYNGAEAQGVRFAQLMKLIDGSRPFDVIDFGCGYGALLEWLSRQNWEFRYQGYDMLESMVQAARRAQAGHPTATFTADPAELRISEYLIAGAIFNNKFEAPEADWREHTLEVLGQMNSLCTRGFSFNMLTSYSDTDKMALRPDLYFANPLFYFDFCKRTFARDVALLHDYGLYDFTILVRKQV